MDWLTNFARGIASLFQRRRVERELDEELQGYLEASAAHKQRNGMTEEEARRAASAELGSGNSVKHQIWSSRWESTIEGILQDIRRQRAQPRQESRLHCDRTAFSGARHRRQHGHLYFDQPGSASQSPGSRPATIGRIRQVRSTAALRAASIWAILAVISLGLHAPDGGESRALSRNRRIRQLFKQGEHPAHRQTGRANANSPALLAPANLVSGNYFSVLGAQPCLAAPSCRRTTLRREAERLSC